MDEFDLYDIIINNSRMRGGQRRRQNRTNEKPNWKSSIIQLLFSCLMFYFFSNFGRNNSKGNYVREGYYNNKFIYIRFS